MPKPNMYQSLHTSIVSGDGNIFEIQIRTKRMDEIAETGIAAHWRYKEGTNYNAKEEQRQIAEKVHWFRDFVTISNEQEGDAKEYMDTLSKDIFEANVYVFTPKGKVIDLPNGSTPIDFAYRVHTKVGDAAVGALHRVTDVQTGAVTPVQLCTDAEFFVEQERREIVHVALHNRCADVVLLVGFVSQPDLAHQLGVRQLKKPGIMPVPGDGQGIDFAEGQTVLDNNADRRRVAGIGREITFFASHALSASWSLMRATDWPSSVVMVKIKVYRPLSAVSCLKLNTASASGTRCFLNFI